MDFGCRLGSGVEDAPWIVANAHMASISGYSAEELIGDNVTLLADSTSDAFAELHASFAESKVGFGATAHPTTKNAGL